MAIVNINPLPGIALHFPTDREVLEEFFEERHIAFTDIQPSHLGQALVCFNSPNDRDALVINSTLPMGMFRSLLLGIIKGGTGGG